MPETVFTIPPQTRSFELDRRSIDEEKRTAQLRFSSEAEVERFFGIEVLDHSPDAVRMSRLQNKAPLLLDHDQQIGVVESAEIRGGEGVATVRFSRSALGEEVWRDVLDGIRGKTSVGYRILDMERGSKKDGKDVYRATSWEPFEVSIVAIPADDSAGIFGNRSAELTTDITIMSKPATAEPTETRENEPAPAANAPEPQTRSNPEPAAPATAPSPDPAELNRQIEERAAAEIERRETIMEIARQFEIPEADAKKAIKEKRSADDFKISVLDGLAGRNTPYFQKPMTERPEIEAGTRAHTLDTWSRSAVQVLGNRASNIVIPDYSKEKDLPTRKLVDGQEVLFHRSMAGAITLQDVAKLDEGIGSDIIDEMTNTALELTVFPVDIISGSTVSLSVRTGASSVGYRFANEGADPNKAEHETRLWETQVIEEPIIVDIQGVLNASKDPGRVLRSHAAGVTRNMFSHIAYNTWYAGTAQANVDPKSPPGLLAQSQTGSAHVVGGGGSTALSSVFFLELGTEQIDHVFGNNNSLGFLENWDEETVDISGKKLRALVNFLSGRVAHRLANKNKFVRIEKLDASTNGLTDAKMFQALRLCEELGMQPNAIFMAPRSKYQLQSSRTATNPTGSPAPLPMEWEGIPLYSSTNISIAETV